MFSNKFLDQSEGLVDHAVESADHAIKSTQHVANVALESLSDSVHDLRKQAAPLVHNVGERAGALLQSGVNGVRETSEHLRDTALRASDGTVKYIKEDPIKAILIAAATGAALMALIGLVSRGHSRGQ
jgi:ElaB/YqjD/DUF883 family membrane-anchored ribosome-binding protein